MDSDGNGRLKYQVKSHKVQVRRCVPRGCFVLGNATLKLHPLRPAPQSAKPALNGHYATVLTDGDVFRQYCRGAKVPGLHWRNDGWDVYHLAELTLLAESRDGVHWTQPDLGLHQVERYPKGNVVLADQCLANHNFTPFIDTRPGVPAGERYKAFGGLGYQKHLRHFRPKMGPGGLFAYASADGVRWKRLRDEPVVQEAWGTFDSQNVAFWSAVEGQYVAYFRTFEKGFRAVARTTSDDFVQWTEPVLMEGRMSKEHLYTNGTHPYFRAPHIYIAPATWFLPGKNPNTRVVLMTTRAGSHRYDRTFGQEQFLVDPKVGNRTNYIAWANGVQTGPGELSFYNLGKRYTLRLDGFASLHAGEVPGEARTRTLRFEGQRLVVNFEAAPSGWIKVGLHDDAGTPVPGYGLDDCLPLTGDDVERVVAWRRGEDVGRFQGADVSLRFALNNADIYSFRFAPAP